MANEKSEIERDVSSIKFFLKAETLIGLLAAAVGLGGAWFVFADDIEDNAKAIKDMRAAHVAMVEDVSEINDENAAMSSSIRVIENELKHINAATDQNAKNIDKILEILQRRQRED